MNTIAFFWLKRPLTVKITLRATDIEFKLPRPSYTIDTLTYIRKNIPQHEFSIIMGSDSYQNLPRWKNHEQFTGKPRSFIFIVRAGFENIPEYKYAHIHILEAPLITNFGYPYP